MMDKETVFSLPAAILVGILAVCLWALWVVTGLGGPWMPWVAGSILVLFIASVFVQARLKARSMAGADEMKEAERQHYRDQVRERSRVLIPLLVFALGQEILNNLEAAGIFPTWARIALSLVLLAGCVWLWWVVFRKKA